MKCTRAVAADIREGLERVEAGLAPGDPPLATYRQRLNAVVRSPRAVPHPQPGLRH